MPVDFGPDLQKPEDEKAARDPWNFQRNKGEGSLGKEQFGSNGSSLFEIRKDIGVETLLLKYFKATPFGQGVARLRYIVVGND